MIENSHRERLVPVRVQEQVGNFCAALVLFNPEPRQFLTNIAEILQAGLIPIVFDNTPSGTQRASHFQQMVERFGTERLHCLSENGNIGLSAAYNRIIERARSLGGIEGLILLDQDSTVSALSVQSLIATYRSVVLQRPVGVLSGSALRSDGIPYRVYELTGEVPGFPQLTRVKMTPSSFSLIPLSTIDRIGTFYDDFFIDHIDVDFCLRCRNAGLLVAIDRKAPFTHQIGNGLLVIAGRAVTPISSPFRHYYQVRNIILSSKRRGASRGEALKEVLKRFLVVGAIGLTKGAAFSRYGFALKGLFDGLRDRGGPMPSGRS
jgi:rhamnosyltransferase